MSVEKLSITRVIAGRPALPAQAYSKTCPPPAPPSPLSTGGASGCVQVPVYQEVFTGWAYGNKQYVYQLIGYREVCY